MAAVTPEYYEFTGPGFLTLIQNHTLVGRAYIQYQDAAGKWKRLYDADGNPVQIGWPSETIPVDVPEGTVWRVVAPYFDCDVNTTTFEFYNAYLDNQPEVDLPDYNGSPIRCDNKAHRGGYTTYYQYFDGSGVLALVDPGKLASPAWVNILYEEDPDRSKAYHIDGERVELGMGVESIEIKHVGRIIVGYQVANCFADDVVFSMTPVDYTGGFPPPLDPPIFDGVIPDITEEVATSITPYDCSVHFQTGGVVNVYSLFGNPAGLVIDPVTGVLSGSFDSEQVAGIYITGTNDDGYADSNNIVLTALAPPLDPPVFDGTVATFNLTVGVEMTPYDFSTHYQTGGLVESYVIFSTPSGLFLDPVTGILSGTPDAANTVNTSVRGDNASGNAESNAFDIIMVPA